MHQIRGKKGDHSMFKEDVEQWELSSTSGRDLNVYYYFGKHFGIA